MKTIKSIKLTVALIVLSSWLTPAAAQPAIVVDHTSVASFDTIPAQYLTAAQAKKLLFRTASVGQNISSGLNCLVYNGANACRTGFSVPATQVPIVTRNQYARTNWLLEFRGNPGWYGKVTDIVSQVNSRAANFNIVTYKQSYVDDTSLPAFWDRTRTPSIQTLENLEASYPALEMVYMTAAIAKVPIQHITDFNIAMRAYTQATGKPLFDLAAIESHRPDGSLCTTSGQPTICAEYNNETSGGHLSNGFAQQHVAKAFWVLMAKLAGWQSGGGGTDTQDPTIGAFVCGYSGTSFTCTAQIDDNVDVTSTTTTITARDAAGNDLVRTISVP